MKRDYLFATIVALAAGATAAAQSGQAGQQAAVGAQSGSTPQPMTITGCLTPGGTTSMPGSGGSSSTGVAGMNADAANTGAFVLMTLGSNGSSAAASANAATPTSYQLIGGNAADMQRYANQRVEIQGSIEPLAAGSSIATSAGTIGAAGTATGAGATPASAGAPPASGAGSTPTAAGTTPTGVGATPTATTPTTTPLPATPSTPPASSIGVGTGAVGTSGSLAPAASRFRVTSLKQVPGGCGGGQ